MTVRKSPVPITRQSSKRNKTSLRSNISSLAAPNFLSTDLIVLYYLPKTFCQATAGCKAIFGWNRRFFLLPEKRPGFWNLNQPSQRTNQRDPPRQFSFPAECSILGIRLFHQLPEDSRVLSPDPLSSLGRWW